MSKRITIEINGYGNETVVGRITKEAYEYWHKLAEEEAITPLCEDEAPPEEARIFEDGDWDTCDGVYHASGPYPDDSQIFIYLDEKLLHDEPLDAFLEKLQTKHPNNLDMQRSLELSPESLGTGYYFIGISEEKGCFVQDRFEIADDEAFNLQNLFLSLSQFDEVTILTQIIYKNTKGKNQYIEMGYETEGVSLRRISKQSC